jgi:hypothetical protein
VADSVEDGTGLAMREGNRRRSPAIAERHYSLLDPQTIATWRGSGSEFSGRRKPARAHSDGNKTFYASGRNEPRIVGSSSETVGWMWTACCIIV